MYAIVNISGKQFRAEKGKSLKVPSQNTEQEIKQQDIERN